MGFLFGFIVGFIAGIVFMKWWIYKSGKYAD